MLPEKVTSAPLNVAAVVVPDLITKLLLLASLVSDPIILSLDLRKKSPPSKLHIISLPDVIVKSLPSEDICSSLTDPEPS